MRRPYRYVLFLLLAIAIPMTAMAHPGRTDGRGGHTDHSTGEYHYHHGYSAHQHYDIDGDGNADCPYEYKNNTRETQPTKSEETSTQQSGVRSILAIIPNLVLASAVALFLISLIAFAIKKDSVGSNIMRIAIGIPILLMPFMVIVSIIDFVIDLFS